MEACQYSMTRQKTLLCSCNAEANHMNNSLPSLAYYMLCIFICTSSKGIHNSN